jgi:predicted nucleic acid-binding protein
LYVDTSVLVSAFTREAATERVQAWFAKQDPQQLAISDWVVTEFSSALSIKLRMNHLSVEQRASAVSLFTNLRAGSLATTPVMREHFLAAARFADQSGLGLRAGDALHVAVAADLGATICTLDRRLAEAAIPLGVSAEMV